MILSIYFRLYYVSIGKMYDKFSKKPGRTGMKYGTVSSYTCSVIMSLEARFS